MLIAIPSNPRQGLEVHFQSAHSSSALGRNIVKKPVTTRLLSIHHTCNLTQLTKPQRPGYQMKPSPTAHLAWWLWPSYWTSLSFSFLLFEMGMRFVRHKWNNTCSPLLGTQQASHLSPLLMTKPFSEQRVFSCDNLGQCCLIELSVLMEISYFCPVPYGSHYSHVAIEPFKCGYCNWATKFFLIEV